MCLFLWRPQTRWASSEAPPGAVPCGSIQGAPTPRFGGGVRNWRAAVILGPEPLSTRLIISRQSALDAGTEPRPKSEDVRDETEGVALIFWASLSRFGGRSVCKAGWTPCA